VSISHVDTHPEAIIAQAGDKRLTVNQLAECVRMTQEAGFGEAAVGVMFTGINIENGKQHKMAMPVRTIVIRYLDVSTTRPFATLSPQETPFPALIIEPVVSAAAWHQHFGVPLPERIQQQIDAERQRKATAAAIELLDPQPVFDPFQGPHGTWTWTRPDDPARTCSWPGGVATEPPASFTNWPQAEAVARVCQVERLKRSEIEAAGFPAFGEAYAQLTAQTGKGANELATMWCIVRKPRTNQESQDAQARSNP
jgi:hypothetical protein